VKGIPNINFYFIAPVTTAPPTMEKEGGDNNHRVTVGQVKGINVHTTTLPIVSACRGD